MRKNLLYLSGCLLASLSTSYSAIISINFGRIEQDDPTASYTNTPLGVTVDPGSWNYEAGNDWSGFGASFTAVGQNIGIWHDAANLWVNPSEGEDSPFHGYLDDGDVNQNHIHITGLTSWLAAVGHGAYRVSVLRSTDNATGFSAIDVRSGLVAGEGGWLNNSDPTGGTIENYTIAGTTFGGGGTHIFETAPLQLDDNGFALSYQRSGSIRASVAGVIIQSIPEPSSVLLFSISGLAVLARRRRQ